jgi:hypothetical protein
MTSPPKTRRYLLLTLALLALTGCYRRVSYASPEGRKVEVVNIGFDTQIASLHAETPDGSVTIEGASSQASVANKLVDLASKLAEQGVGR